MVLVYAIQVLTGGVGGVMCALQIMGTVFETALFMASFGLSGFFLLTHLFMLNENLAAKYPKLGIIVSTLHKDLYEKSNINLIIQIIAVAAHDVSASGDCFGACTHHLQISRVEPRLGDKTTFISLFLSFLLSCLYLAYYAWHFCH